MPLAGFIVLNSGVDRSDQQDIADVRWSNWCARRSAGRGLQDRDDGVDRLPKTRSGKILRGTMRKIADGEDWKMPATIDDPAILDEITEALNSAGIGT